MLRGNQHRPGKHVFAPMKIFIPMNDDMLDALNPSISLVPYQPGLPTIGQLAGLAGTNHQSSNSNNSSPGLASSSRALPALSSSTYLAGPALG